MEILCEPVSLILLFYVMYTRKKKKHERFCPLTDFDTYHQNIKYTTSRDSLLNKLKTSSKFVLGGP